MTDERKFIKFEDWKEQVRINSILPLTMSQFDRGVRCGEALIGTCSSIDSEKEDGDDADSIEFCDGVDSVAFECNECGWWCEIGEANLGEDGDICDDCSPCHGD